MTNITAAHYNAPYCEGPLDCRIAFIGEAPGANEVQAGRPFVGSAGQKLDQLMSRSGIVRSACYFDNVFQFRPNNNDIEPYLDTDKGRESEQFVHARAELVERLATCKANIIVALGNVPLYTLTGMSQVTKRRGSLLVSSSDFGARKVLPTIHPSAALRQYIYEHFIVHDLRLALKESGFPELNRLKREFNISPSFEQCLQYIERCKHTNLVAFDIEVIGDEISHVSLAISATDGICIPFVERGTADYFTPEQEAIIWLGLTSVLEDKNITKLGQNIAFDATFVHNRLGICVHNVADTMVAQGVIYPDFPKGLDFLVSTYCNGEPYYKDEGKRHRKNPFGSDERFRTYSAMDSLVLHEIFPQQLKDMESLGNTKTYNDQVRTIEPLVFIQESGVLIDTKKKKAASEDCALRILDLEAELTKLCGSPMNPNSPKQLKTYFYVSKGLKPYTKDGSITVDEKALVRIAAKGFKEASIILQLRHLRKMKGTYYDMAIDSDNRLRCSFNPVGTVSGRISSSKTIFGTGGNMQNLPPEMKSIMVADPGFVFFNMDLSQAENRIVAYIANEHRMIEAFETGVDLHKLTASLIFGVPLNQVSDEDGSCRLGGGRFSQRFWGKKANHGLNYDLGPGQFALLYEIPEQDARFIIQRYHSAYPGIRQWHASVQDQLSKHHKLTDCLGNTRIFMERWGPELFKEAYSFIPQSTVARKLNRDGLCFAYYDLADTPIRLANQVHDSIVFKLPLSMKPIEMANLIWKIKERLESPIEFRGRTFSIPSDIKVGFNLKDMNEFKSKNLKIVPHLARGITLYLDANRGNNGTKVQ